MKFILYKKSKDFKNIDETECNVEEHFKNSDFSLEALDAEQTPDFLRSCTDITSARERLSQSGITDPRVQEIVLTLIYSDRNSIGMLIENCLDRILTNKLDGRIELVQLGYELNVQYNQENRSITFHLPIAYHNSRKSKVSQIQRIQDYDSSFYRPPSIPVNYNRDLEFLHLGNVSLTISLPEEFAQENIKLDEIILELSFTEQNTLTLLAVCAVYALFLEKMKDEGASEEENILFEFAKGWAEVDFLTEETEQTEQKKLDLLLNSAVKLESLNWAIQEYKKHRNMYLGEISQLTENEQKSVEVTRCECLRAMAAAIIDATIKQGSGELDIIKHKLDFYRKNVRNFSFASIRKLSEEETIEAPWKIIASTVKKQTEEMNQFVGAFVGVMDTEVFKLYLLKLQDEIAGALSLLHEENSAGKLNDNLEDLAKKIQLAEFEFYLAIAKDDTIPLHDILEYFGEKYQYEDLEDKLKTELPSLFKILSYVQHKGETELNRLCDKYQRKIFSLAYQNVEQELEAGSLKIRLIGLEEQFLREVVENSEISLADIQYFITQTQTDWGEAKPAERTELEKAIDQKGLLSEENRAQLKSDFQREKAKVTLFAKNEAVRKEMLAEKSKDFYTRVRNETKITHAKLLQEAESTIFTQAFWAYLISYSLNYDFKYQKPSDFRTNVIFVGLMLWRAVKSIVELPLLSASAFFYGMATASAKKAEENYWYNIPRVLAYGLHKFFDVGFFIARATLSPQTNKEEMTKKGKMWGYLSLSTTVFSWTAITVATLGATSITLAGVAAAVLPSVVVEAFDTELEGISEIAKEIDPVFPQENATARFTLVAQVAAGLTALAGILYGVGKKLGSYWSTSKTEVNSPVSDEIDVTTTYNKLLQALPPKAQVRAISEEADKTCCLSPIKRENRNISFISPDSNVSIDGNFMEDISEIDLSDSVSPSGIGQNDGQSELSGSSPEEASDEAEWETFLTV